VSVPIRWTDLVDPSYADLQSALPDVDPDAIELLAAPSGRDGRAARPLLESHGAYILAVFVVPKAYPELDRVVYREISIVATESRVVTVRKSTSEGVIASEQPIASRVDSGATAGQLVHALADHAADRYLVLIDALYGEIDELEDRIDELPGEAVRHRLVELRHELLHARRLASATRASIRRVVDGRAETTGGGVFPREVQTAFAETYETLVRAGEELDIARDLIASVRDFHQAKIQESQNEVVKKLTVVASLVLVPTFIVGVYGQNFVHMPELDWRLGYLFSWGVILAITLAQLALFRWRRWL
jgi:magnesium transporter